MLCRSRRCRLVRCALVAALVVAAIRRVAARVLRSSRRRRLMRCRSRHLRSVLHALRRSRSAVLRVAPPPHGAAPLATPPLTVRHPRRSRLASLLHHIAARCYAACVAAPFGAFPFSHHLRSVCFAVVAARCYTIAIRRPAASLPYRCRLVRCPRLTPASRCRSVFNARLASPTLGAFRGASRCRSMLYTARAAAAWCVAARATARVRSSPFGATLLLSSPLDALLLA